MVAMDSGADNGFFYTSQVMHFSSPFTVFLIYHKQLEYDILSATEYNEIVYGTNDSKKIDLLKMGLTISMISRLEEEKQLQNISLDANGNMHTTAAFEAYKREVDDFFRFSLDRVIN